MTAAFNVSDVMTDPERPSDEALEDLNRRLDALSVSTRREPKRFDEEGTSAGYRIVGELLGGILGGLGLGALLDRVAGTRPWGLIAGVLIGLVASTYLVARSAMRTVAPKDQRTGAKSGRASGIDDTNASD